MPHLRAQPAPPAVDGTIGERDQIERILDERVERLQRSRFARIELARHPAVHNRQRARADVLGELEVLEEPEPERLEVVRRRPVVELVVPSVDERLPPADVTHRPLPVVAELQTPAFDNAPAGEPEEPGLHVGEELHQVLSQAVRSILPGLLWIERHHVDVDLALATRRNLEPRARVSRGWPQRRLVPLPVAREPGEGAFGETLSPVVRDPRGELPGTIGLRPYISGQHVLGAGLDPDAAESRVDDLECPVRRIAPQAEILRVVLVERAVRADDQFAGGGRIASPPVQRLRELERPVLDPLGIEPPVGSEVDVLEEDSEHRRRDGRTGPAEVERHHVGSRIAGLSRRDRHYAHRDGGKNAAPRALPEEAR